MCKYCDFKFDENGECWDRIRLISSVQEPFGFTKIRHKTTMYADTDKVCLNLEVSSGGTIDDLIFDTYIPIEYCPFCGRKLVIPERSKDD